MANKDNPRGLVPVKKLGNGYETAGFTTYKVASGQANSIFNGTAVELTAAGVIQRATDGVGNSAKIVGIAAGVFYTDTDGKPRVKNNWVGGTTTKGGVAAEIKVYDDPDQLFIVQSDGATDQTAIGANAPMVGNANGSTTTGISSMELDHTGITANSDQLRIVGISELPDNTAGETNVDLIVRINTHAYTNLAGI